MAERNGNAAFVNRTLHACKLRQFFVGSITDLDTVVTGIPGIVKVMVRNPSTTTNPTTHALTTAALDGTTGSSKRLQAYLSNAETGEITLEATTANAIGIVMVWSRG